VRRGEIRWYTFALPDKRRPVPILSRDSVLPRLNEIIVVFRSPRCWNFGLVLRRSPRPIRDED
jgi:hypothetical protein